MLYLVKVRALPWRYQPAASRPRVAECHRIMLTLVPSSPLEGIPDRAQHQVAQPELPVVSRLAEARRLQSMGQFSAAGAAFAKLAGVEEAEQGLREVRRTLRAELSILQLAQERAEAALLKTNRIANDHWQPTPRTVDYCRPSPTRSNGDDAMTPLSAARQKQVTTLQAHVSALTRQLSEVQAESKVAKDGWVKAKEELRLCEAVVQSLQVPGTAAQAIADAKQDAADEKQKRQDRAFFACLAAVQHDRAAIHDLGPA